MHCRELTTVDGELVETARSIAGRTTPAEAAVTIAEWVRANVAYVPGSTGVRTSAREAWALRKGACQDIAQLTAGVLRSGGIPARYVSGYLYPRPDAEIGDTVSPDPDTPKVTFRAPLRASTARNHFQGSSEGRHCPESLSGPESRAWQDSGARDPLTPRRTAPGRPS